MAHKQKYQWNQPPLARVCIVCSYIKLSQAHFDFQNKEENVEVKSGCQNLRMEQWLLVKLKSIWGNVLQIQNLTVIKFKKAAQEIQVFKLNV